MLYTSHNQQQPSWLADIFVLSAKLTSISQFTAVCKEIMFEIMVIWHSLSWQYVSVFCLLCTKLIASWQHLPGFLVMGRCRTYFSSAWHCRQEINFGSWSVMNKQFRSSHLFPTLPLAPVSSFVWPFIRGKAVMIMLRTGKPTLLHAVSMKYQHSCDVRGIPRVILHRNTIIQLFNKPSASRDFLLDWMFPRITSNKPKSGMFFSDTYTVCVGGKSEQ